MFRHWKTDGVCLCYLQEEAQAALEEVLGSIKVQDRGVFVQASTLGSLEALLEYLKTSSIPVSHIHASFDPQNCTVVL